MKKYTFLFIVFIALNLVGCSKDPQNPNIIIIYTDDLGYGDVSAY